MRISFRLSEKKDRDIIEALSNVKNKTLEIKKLIRAGLGNRHAPSASSYLLPRPMSQPPMGHQPPGEEDLLDNLLSNFD